MKQREVAPGLTVQHGDDGHWLVFNCDGRHGAINVENAIKSTIVKSAVIWWIDDALAELEARDGS